MRLLVALCVLLSGCAEFYPVPPQPISRHDICAAPMFDGVSFPESDEGGISLMLRFGTPTAGNLACMRDMFNLTDVFQLDLGRDPAVPGITNHYHPLSVLAVTEAEVDSVLADMVATCAKPGKVCGVHCAHGQDRTGLLFGLWIWHHIEHTPENADAVYEITMRHGFHPYRALWNVLVKKLGWS